MKAAEEARDLCQSLFDIFIAHALNTTFQLVVREVGQVGGSLLSRVHEVLEAVVATLFEPQIVVEAVGDETVNLFLELQKLGREFDRVLQKSLVFDDATTKLFDELAETVNNFAQVAIFATEAFVKQAQLILSLILNHVFASSLFVEDVFVASADQLGLHSLHEFCARFWLQDASAVSLLVLEGLVCQF